MRHIRDRDDRPLHPGDMVTHDTRGRQGIGTVIAVYDRVLVFFPHGFPRLDWHAGFRLIRRSLEHGRWP